MRQLAPHETLRWVARLHRAFYVEGVDITDTSMFPGLVDGFDVDPKRFAQLLADDATSERTRQDFAEAQRYGVAGFPTVLFRDGDELAIVTRGFVPWDQLEATADRPERFRLRSCPRARSECEMGPPDGAPGVDERTPVPRWRTEKAGGTYRDRIGLRH